MNTKTETVEAINWQEVAMNLANKLALPRIEMIKAVQASHLSSGRNPFFREAYDATIALLGTQEVTL